MLGSNPRDHGQAQSRWTLAGLAATVPQFAGASLSGIWRTLRGHRLRWKRARDHLRSPDPAYREKLAHLTTIRTQVDDDPAGAVLLYLDEVTYYRQPTLANGYAAAGSARPHAERSTRSNTTTRIIGALNALTGKVIALQQTRIGVPAIVQFFRQMVATYPHQRLYVVLDNWPVHFHPDVLAALEPQQSPFPFFRPRSWPTEPSPRAKRLHLPIQLVTLPTYSPWLNPIEKLWRWLQQDVLHLHQYANDLDALRDRVLAFLARFAQPSRPLLRYTGLLKLRR